jgi:hypothetical protein
MTDLTRNQLQQQYEGTRLAAAAYGATHIKALLATNPSPHQLTAGLHNVLVKLQSLVGLYNQIDNLVSANGALQHNYANWLDANGEGTLNASDPAFAAIKLWGDVQSNGLADQGEMQSLSDLGITSINLKTEQVNYSAADTQGHTGMTALTLKLGNYSSASIKISEAFTCNALAMRITLRNVRFFSPRSTAPIYVRCKPASNDKPSCENPAATRRARKARPSRVSGARRLSTSAIERFYTP